MIGLVDKAEADPAVNAIALTEERYYTLNFRYPYIFSEILFITNKSTPESSSMI